MIPGMNARKMQQMMRRMGIQQQEIDAVEVVIKTKDKKIVISNPQVSKVNMMGQKTYQIIGEEEEFPLDDVSDDETEINTSVEISDDDIDVVVQQTNVSKEKAKELLEKNNGDIAETILEINNQKEE